MISENAGKLESLTAIFVGCRGCWDMESCKVLDVMERMLAYKQGGKKEWKMKTYKKLVEILGKCFLNQECKGLGDVKIICMNVLYIYLFHKYLHFGISA